MKLSDYYRNTLNKNDNFTGGWAPIYYGVFSKIINDNNYKIVAELGIGYGSHAKQILKNTNVEKLYLIDPTKYYPNDNFASDIMNTIPNTPGDNFNELAALIKAELAPWENRYTWFRTESLTITNEQIPNNHLDCIFIDGDHSYNSVLADLNFWWPKIRPGGMLLGDDYWMDDVKRAVNDFAASKNLYTNFLFRDGSDYKIFMFKKNNN